jgi:Flp pilus assembly protein TadD
MSGIPRDFDPPENWQDFERLALRLLQRRWQCASLELFGGRGQKQYGVDIIDPTGGVPFRAGQCKRYDRTQALTEAAITTEVDKAKSFPVRIDQYAIVTTAKRSVASQLAVLKINKEHAEQGLFEVALITWDQINDFLNENSDIADLFYGGLGAQAIAQITVQLNELLESARATNPITRDLGTPSPFDNDIDEAKRYFEDHQYSLSRLLLQRLRERHWDLLSSRQRFRILSNLGASRLAENDGEGAARLFLEAKEFQPEDRLALENEVLACELLGLGDKAFSLASELREKFPVSGRAWAAWLEHSPSTADELEAQIPDEVKTSVEVCMVMARRSLMEKEYIRGERYARKAVEALPARAYPSWLLGQALLTAQVFTGGVDQRFGDKSDESQKLREASRFFTTSADLAKKEGSNQLRALALLGRSFVRDMLGEKTEAEADVDAAFRDAPDDPSVLVSYATMLRTRGDLSNAIDTLRKAVGKGVVEQGIYLLAESLSMRGETKDLEEAVDLCGNLIASKDKLQPGLREHALATTLNSLAKLGRLDEAEAILDNLPPGALSSVALACLRARIMLLRHSSDEARQLAIQANQLVGEGTSSEDLRTLAQLLLN